MSARPWYVPANRVHVGKVPAVPSCPAAEPCQLAEAAMEPTGHWDVVDASKLESYAKELVEAEQLTNSCRRSVEAPEEQPTLAPQQAGLTQRQSHDL